MSNARNIATATDVKPMFSAYQSVAQSLAANTWTKIQFQTKEFDLTNAFDNVTNFRFQPTKAGYYQVSCGVAGGSAATYTYLALYKNGSHVKVLGAGTRDNSNGSCIVYLNGSTDYIETYSYFSASQSIIAGAIQTYFQAHYIANGV